MTEPNSLSPGLVAHKGLRGQILVALKRDQPLTAQELASQHDVTANAIRRHLKELEVEGLIESGREQRGQGAPTYTYKLSDGGETLFPKRYDTALTAVLDYLERKGGREEIRRFFDLRFQQQANELLARLGDVDTETKVVAVVEYLSNEGFMADWSRDSHGITIAERNCAMHAVAERYPELCESELRFLQNLFGPGVVREQRIVDGCNACEYAFHLHDTGKSVPSSSTENA